MAAGETDCRNSVPRNRDLVGFAIPLARLHVVKAHQERIFSPLTCFAIDRQVIEILEAGLDDELPARRVVGSGRGPRTE